MVEEDEIMSEALCIKCKEWFWIEQSREEDICYSCKPETKEEKECERRPDDIVLHLE